MYNRRRYKEHIHKLKCKTSAQNNILTKLSNRKLGSKPATIKTTALTHCYSMAEYAYHVLERSTHVSKLDPALNEACRSKTRCLRPITVENVYHLAGNAPPGVRRATTSRQERRKQPEDPRHSIYNHEPVNKRLKSRNSPMHLLKTLQQNDWAHEPTTGGLYNRNLKTPSPSFWCTMVTMEMSKKSKNWNRPLQVEHAKMEIQ